MGRAWVGSGGREIEGGKGLVSANGERVYRRPALKADGTVQANFERMGPGGKGKPIGNAHVVIVKTTA